MCKHDIYLDVFGQFFVRPSKNKKKKTKGKRKALDFQIVQNQSQKQPSKSEIMEPILEHSDTIDTHTPEIAWTVHICFNGVECILRPVGSTPHLGTEREKGKQCTQVASRIICLGSLEEKQTSYCKN